MSLREFLDSYAKGQEEKEETLMPDATDSLSITSNRQDRDKAVSACVAQLVGEGREQSQAVAICIDKVDKATGIKSPR